jgi:hypothetical protein
MSFYDLMDTDLIEIKGRRMTVGQFKIRIRRGLKVEDITNPAEVAMALNMLHKSQRYEIKLTYDDSERMRMMEDLIELVFRDRTKPREAKSSGSTGSNLRKPIPPPIAQKSQDVPESTLPDRFKRLKSQAQDGEEFVDLRSKIIPLQKDEKLKEGDNLIHTTPSGLNFIARVEGGKIVGWVITDKLGREVKETDSGCWSCREAGGGTQCFRVFCPKK